MGILRLIAEQQDPEALGWWREDGFVLESSLGPEDIVRFLAESYAPTPLVAPWNKDGGFYGRNTVVAVIERSTDPRLEAVRSTIRVARELLREFGWVREPGRDREKARFLAALRARLPDEAIRWLDAVAVLAGDDPVYVPLLGTGGVDGRVEFTRVFHECVIAIFGLGRARSRRSPRDGLRAALFGAVERGASMGATGGLLAPASVDAPNAAPGFVGPKRLNPWDFLLAIEGALLMAGSVARRFGPMPGRLAAIPFTVEPVGAGHASAGYEDARGEVWLPLWTRPLGLRELTHLFREGRAQWRARQSATATDMARAIATLGVDRGIAEFRRVGIQGRSGRSYLAVPLGRWPVVERREVRLLGDLDGFLSEMRAAARGRHAPGAVIEACRRLEEAIMDHAAYGGRDRLLAVLLAASHAELTLARRPAARERGVPRPLAGLSSGWVYEADDGSVEFELALAVASIGPGRTGVPGEFRRHLEPIERTGDRWNWSATLGHEVVWTGRDLVADLAAVLERRLLEAERESAGSVFDGRVRVHPAAVTEFLRGGADFERLARLIEGLALVGWAGSDAPRSLPRSARWNTPPPPATYAVLKLAMFGRPLRVQGTEIEIRPDATIPGLLRAGDVWGAMLRAARRLRAAGLTPRGIPWGRSASPLARDRETGGRLLAALVVPVHEAPLLRVIQEAAPAEREEAPERKEEGP